MEDEMSEELRKCPFCGGTNLQIVSNQVVCVCPAINGDPSDFDYPSIKEWNTRPLEDALIAERDKLQAKLDLDHATSFKIMEDYRIAEAELRRKLEAAKEALAFALPELRMLYREFEAKRDMELLMNDNKMRNQEYIFVRMKQIKTAIKVADNALAEILNLEK